jgi:hypothetical protein
MMEDLDESPPFMPAPAKSAQASDGSHATGEADAPAVGPRVTVTVREWVSPGVSLRKRILTGLGVALVVVVFIAIALYEQTSMLVSVIIGTVFILGFIGYLRVVAPKPFALRLDQSGVTRTDTGADPLTIAWGFIAKVREEQFKNGTSVSLAVYKRVGARGLHRAWVVYRDDIPDFDGFLHILHEALPTSAQWVQETVHE